MEFIKIAVNNVCVNNVTPIEIGCFINKNIIDIIIII